MSRDIPADKDELAIGTVIFTAGDTKQQADYWDDSELIDHWDKTVEAYRKQSSSQTEQVATDPPYHKRKAEYGYGYGNKFRQGHVTKKQPSLPKKIVQTSRPALRKEFESNARQQGSIPTTNTLTNAQGNYGCCCNIVKSHSENINLDDLSNLMMAWYYCGYYTGLHQGQQ
ncbi:hypothetical protein BD408DRAFT_431720 [Parasitella parasitica]|nr:hypothetical protein BD408DRAFT_431720 [Parasitella parasitica]